MTHVREWLPASVDLGKAQAAIADLMAGWSRHWFAGNEDFPAGMFASTADLGRELRGIEWRSGGTGSAIGVAAGGVIMLGACAMGVAARIGDRTSADLEILRQLGEECFQDLCRRAGELFALRTGTQWEAATQGPAQDDMVYRAEISDRGDRTVLAVALTSCQLARLVKSLLPAPPEPPPLASAPVALAASQIRLSALLGGCQVTLAEIEALAPGDVLVLDRDVGETLPLAIEHLPIRRGTCAVARQGDRLSLQITQPLEG